MGLGAYPDVSLQNARLVSGKWSEVAQQGLDPIKERERERREAARNIHLLNDIALDAFESRKAELKGDGKDGRCFSPLELHVLPKLGKVPVAEIDQRDIRDTLALIWHSKTHTALKAMNRLSICIRHAAALGLDGSPALITWFSIDIVSLIQTFTNFLHVRYETHNFVVQQTSSSSDFFRILIAPLHSPNACYGF